MDTRTPYFGIIEGEVPETTYQLVAGKVDLPYARHRFHDKEIQYYQPDVSAVSCTIHGGATAISALTGHRFALDDLRRFWDIDLNLKVQPAIEGTGGYVHVAVDIMREGYTAEKLKSYGVQLISPEADQAFDRGYMLVVSFGGNTQYGADASDGVLDLTKFIDAIKWYHCLTICLDEKDPTMMNLVVDNYWREGKTNTYKIPRANLSELVKNKIFSNNAFVFAIQSELDHPASLVSPWAVKSWEKALRMDIVTSTSDPKSIAGTAWDEKLLHAAKFLTILVGNLTLERKIVAMDNAKLLG